MKFESEDGGTTVECAYDSMGRRFEKKVTVGGTTGFHACYLYRDYLQVAECDLTGETPVLVRSYLWDPSEPQATRVLAMTSWEANGTQEKEHLYCMHDAMKNVTSLFGEARGRRALYEYRPYGGLVTSEGNMAQENKFRFSSEYMDDELGLIYYNYRHLNPHDGRWISRDPIMEQGGWNLYRFICNSLTKRYDLLGLADYQIGVDDPPIIPDVGAGVWNSKGWTLKIVALKGLILNCLNTISVAMPDAVAHLQHYFRSTGSDYTIRLQKMIDEVPSAKDLYERELNMARSFIDTLPDGKHSITSGTVSIGYNGQEESSNWFYAVGGYKAWGKGNVTICNGEYTFEFEYKFYDRYNWDNGKQVTFLGCVITDEFMGEFHRQGIAREFDMRGSIKKTLKLEKGKSLQIYDGWESEKLRR